jgi:hypothetical protein
MDAPEVEWPRAPLRRRLLVLVLAVATALAVVALMLERPGDPKRGLPRAVPPCERAPGGGCVGDKADVMLVMPAPASATR